MSLDCYGGFLNQKNTTKKKKVQLSGHRLQCQIVLAGSLLYFSVGSSIKLQITTGKKGTVVWDGQMTVPFSGRNLIDEGRNPPKNIAHNFHFSKYEIW